MSESVGTIIKVAASIAVAAAVVAFVWFAVGENIPDEVEIDARSQRAQIQNQQLCEITDGTWTDGNNPPCE